MDERERPAWYQHLVWQSKNRIAPTMTNVAMVLREDVTWAHTLAWDELSEQPIKLRPPTWGDALAPGAVLYGPWTDDDSRRAAEWIAYKHRFSAPTGAVSEAVLSVAQRRRVHPIKYYLEKLDKTPPQDPLLDTWLVRFLGVEDNAYTRTVGRITLIGAVKRIYEPGCKFDTCLVLEGIQGKPRKTSTIRTLAVRDEWFLETTLEMGTKDSYMLLRDKWLVELSELDSLSRAEHTRAKAFISAQKDTYRLPYGRATRDFLRHIAFFGTTNDDQYLKDVTGDRRYYPVFCRRADLEGLEHARDQLWAEAFAAYKARERCYVHDPAIEAMAEEEQRARYQTDPWEDLIARFLVTLEEADAQSIFEHLKIDPDRQDRSAYMRIGNVMKRLGWRKARRTLEGGARSWTYLCPELAQDSPSPESK